MRSPNWREEELKLALELYLSKDLKWLAKMNDSTKEIQALSQLLNVFDLFKDPKPIKFRSCSSIRMKLSNFKALDSRYSKSSLTNVSSLDKDIWNRYHNDYAALQQECGIIIEKHYRGTPSDILKEYIKRYDKVIVSKIENEEFFEFANSTYHYAEKYRIQALSESNLQLSQRIVNTCFEIMKALEWCTQTDINKYARNEITYKEHGGVNQAPVDGTREKIGRHVQETIEQLVSKGLITKRVLSNLTDLDWSRKNFHINHAFMINVDTRKSLASQLRDQNGYLRYWKRIYTIAGKDYCVCKEWYESGRKYFDAWSEIVSKRYVLRIEEETFKSLIMFIRENDQASISIKREDIYDKMNGVRDKEGLLQQLMKMGLLVPFQGTERELVVDDYDLLFDMIANPAKYI